MYFLGSPDGSDRVILMGLWYTEKGHDRIAHEFFNKTLIFADYFGNPAKDLTRNLFDIFRVQALRHGGIAGHIREKDSDALSLTVKFGSGKEGIVI